MGQQQASPYSHTEELEELINSDRWEITNTIDLSFTLDENTIKYTIKLKSDIPSNCVMCVLFPNHHLNKNLWTSSYFGHLNSFSTELNKRIQESDRKDLCIVITSGNNCYKFNGFVGRLYLWWAESIKIETLNNNQTKENVPILVETDGKWSNRSLFLFSEKRLINLKNVTFIEPIHYNLYCCETDPRKRSLKCITTLSDKKADQMVEDLVLQKMRELPDEDLPFFSEEDGSNKN
jgi:hypothetical protein